MALQSPPCSPSGLLFQDRKHRFSSYPDTRDQSEDKPILDDNSLAFIKPLPEPDDQECERDPDGWVVQWERLREKAEMVQKEKEEQREAAPAEVGEGQPEKKERQREEQCEEGVVREGRGKGRIRLTGQHPLNAEPPVPAMMKAGLITPSSIHFVRNHGPVPRIHWNSHRVVVCGMVEQPQSFSMEELAALPSVEIPVTVVCDSNRRKELNTIRRSKGFDWGPGALGTSLWKGASLSWILKQCGVKPGARYVNFEAADQLPKGLYGTSIPLEAALDERNDMMLAYEMNKQPLPPDHGYPVRMILPGYIGGRMVKWLTKIEVSEHQSESFYHTHDHKVLPPEVDFSNAESGGWWSKPETLLNHVNVNSVITSPGHEEFFPIGHGLKRYTLRGYAYGGGGGEVRRVEVTLDGGKTWLQCKPSFPEQGEEGHLRHGIHSWVWCHWSIELEAWRLLKSEEIAVRAFDAQLNTQPDQPTWNLMGMMNNCWYRVKVEIQEESSPGQTPACIFKHPVQPGSLVGGWMVGSDEEPVPTRVAECTAELRRLIPMSEIRKHNTKEDCWVVIDGRVFDMTAYLKDHPGGVCPVLLKSGEDASKEYYAIHAQDSHEIREYYCIGTAVDDLLPGVQVPASLGDAPRALNPRHWIDITLVERTELSHDSRKFRFALPGAEKGVQLGLPVGQHVLLGAYIGEQLMVRPYTPIGPVLANEDVGCVEFVIKVYFKNKSKIFFPQGGLMSQYIDSLKIGDRLKMKGPAGHVIYHGRGRIAINAKPMQVRHISMVAGGTGITPMYQVARAICKDPGDTTRVALLYANHSTEDILLRQELDELARDHPQFQVWYTVSRKPESDQWKYSVGRVVQHMLKARLFPWKGGRHSCVRPSSDDRFVAHAWPEIIGLHHRGSL